MKLMLFLGVANSSFHEVLKFIQILISGGEKAGFHGAEFGRYQGVFYLIDFGNSFIMLSCQLAALLFKFLVAYVNGILFEQVLNL